MFEQHLLPVCCQRLDNLLPAFQQGKLWRLLTVTVGLGRLASQVDKNFELKKATMTSYIRIPKKCEFCGIEFIAKTLQTRYCSHNCSRRFWKARDRDKKLSDYEEKNRAKESESKPIPSIVSPNDKEYLSIAESAALLGVSKRTLERLIASDKIHVTRLNRRVVISKKSIERLFQQ